jgi:hypothetical protein
MLSSQHKKAFLINIKFRQHRQSSSLLPDSGANDRITLDVFFIIPIEDLMNLFSKALKSKPTGSHQCNFPKVGVNINAPMTGVPE